MTYMIQISILILKILVNSGKDIQVIFFAKFEQFQQYEKELNKIAGFDHNSDIVQYIIIKPVNN